MQRSHDDRACLGSKGANLTHYAATVQEPHGRRCRVSIVVSHPIQHFCPQYRSLAAIPGIELSVHFDSMRGAELYYDADFGRTLSWGSEIVRGFHWTSGVSTPLKEALNDFDPDWLIVYGYRGVSWRALRWALQRRGTRIAYISDSEARNDEPVVRRFVRRSALRLLFARLDAFLTVGEANEAFYAAAGVPRRKQIRMNFPIESDWVDAVPTRSPSQELKEALGIPRDHRVVLTVGKLISRKRQIDILACARALAGSPISFVVLGDGPDRKELEAAASELVNVHLVGFVPPEELPGYYSLADIYVHPSAYDPHPLVITEAAAFGCAFVVSDAIGSWGETDDVRPFDNGLVYRTGDVSELTAAIDSLAKDADTLARMSASSRAYSREAQRRAHGGFIADLLELGRA